jgi:glycerol kinase
MERLVGKAIMALDQGTTSSRTLVLGRGGEVLAQAQQEFPQHYPRPGWVEHDPLQIWESQRATMAEALRRSGLRPADIHAIGIANQRETTVLWDRKTGAPVGPAIVWQCRRTAPRCEAIRQRGDEPMLRRKTGLVADAYFSGTKLAWLLDEVPGARARAERGELAFGTVDAWLIFKLTGGARHVSDPSNASRTLLYSLEGPDGGEGGWDPDLLRYFNIPPSVLPTLVPTSGALGETAPDLLGAAIPIASAVGDQQAALFGQGCFRPGMLKSTYGTGCFLLMNTGAPPVRSQGGLLTSVGWRLDGTTTHVLEGSIFIGGAVIQWLRDGLGLLKTAAESEAVAASVPDSGGVYLVPAFVGLGAPHWNPDARGAVVGLTRGSSRAHLVRAALESIAFQNAEMVALMSQEVGQAPPALRVDGGATANNLLCQLQADLLGLPVERPRLLETTAAGAAYLAGLATGFWTSLDEVEALRQVDRVFEPARDDAWRAEQMAGWKRAVQRVL